MSDRLCLLESIRPADLAWAGAKATRLAEARRAGERVPDGFVIGAGALDDALAKSGLVGERDAVLEAARREAADWEALAEAFADRVAALIWPAGLQTELMKMLAAFPPTLFAVRSSANLEDAEASAAAGVFDSALQVPPNEIMKAACRCWAAAYRPRALAHLLATGQDPARLRMGLLVQRMIKARAAGVLFTTDPSSPRRDGMRLAATPGLGEAVVQGEAATETPLPKRGALPAHPFVPARMLAKLRRLGARLERRAGRALDCEWAWGDDGLWLLQTRPIAGMPPGAEARPAIRWSRDLAEERFPDPISPLGWTALQSALRVNLDTLDRRFGLQARRPDEVATVIGSYVYNNRDFFAIPHSMRFRAAAHWPYVGGYAGTVASALAPWRWLALTRPRRGPLGSGPHDPRFRLVAGLFETVIFKHSAEVEAAWERDYPHHRRVFAALDAEDPESMPTPELMAYARRVMAASDAFMEPDLAIYVIKMACRWALEAIAELVDGERRPETLATLTGGLSSNATLTMNAALDALYAAVAADARLVAALRKGSAAATALAWSRSPAAAARDAFLAEYGHITLSWDIREPTYRERPALLDELLAQRLASDAPGDAETRRQALVAAREAEAARLEAGLAGARWAQGFFRRVLETLHTAMRLDEEHHLSCGRLIPAERRIVATLAARFVSKGALDAPDDIHFLTLDEVFALADEPDPHARRRLVARRRLAFERSIAARPIDDYIGDTPVITAASPVAEGALAGRPASPGVAEGVVRVVASMEDMAAFRPGEILVVPTPKPCYTPLFAVAAGLVSARGSTLSHGLISAREYGLPAVTELPEALLRLKTGQRVRIDGHTGAVTPLSSRPIRLTRRVTGGSR